MKKQIIITRILEFGGSNTYLKTLVKYFGEEMVILVLKKKEEEQYINKISSFNHLTTIYFPAFKELAVFRKNSVINYWEEILGTARSIFKILKLSLRYRFATVTVSVIDPEKYLYLLWLPFIKVKYVLHTEPSFTGNSFTSFTCNKNLSYRKGIITVSHANRNRIIQQWNIKKNKQRYVKVIYNCLIEENKRDTESLIAKQTKIIVTMGHVAEYKNPFFWLEVATNVIKKYPEVIFYWLGNGSLLEEFIEKTAYTNQINFVGLTETPDIFLKKAWLYYQPSLMETQGIAVIEAMASSLPCIVSNVGGLPESVAHNENGFVVDANNLDENVNSIIKLLENENLATTFGANSYIRYKARFTYEVFENEMDIYYK